MAGTPADLEQAEELKIFWENEAGLDRAKLYPYDVLLSYPKKDTPNKIEMQDDDGNVLFTSQLFEKILSPEQNQSDVVSPFNAYSASGEPKVSSLPYYKCYQYTSNQTSIKYVNGLIMKCNSLFI